MSTLIAAFLLAMQPPALRPELQPLAFLVDSCWRGTFLDGRQTDTHCFTPWFGGAFVRDVHVVEGALRPYWGETFYRWDAATGQIRFDYYASDGAHSGGPAVPAANGLSFPETRRTAEGGEMRIGTTWTRDGADAYLVLSEIITGENRRVLLRMRMIRTGPAPR